MHLQRLSAANRRKLLAMSRLDKPATAYIRWDNVEHVYHGVIEVYNSSTGEKYQLCGNQVEWMELHKQMMERFAKDAKAIS